MGVREQMKRNHSDPEDFQSIFRTHYPQVVRYIIRLVKDQALAEDIAQEVFMKLYATNIREIENISAWLIKTAVHTSYNTLRQEKRRMLREEKEHSKETANSHSTEETWLQLDEIDSVRQTLHDLNERDRLLLLMKYSGYDYRELAKAAEVESSSIGTLLARAKKRFREFYLRKRGQM
ncbi:sigma-70 family RNA polymerase sigma factor [Brevibacillus sp. SYSU BS000544]|uniref:sigma-70 family RNA polymerase sigma factor n=1 Tax=Brevibacillus sp. SYSU BS000544 TaxID=3416443 RepID=UPI003CE51377